MSIGCEKSFLKSTLASIGNVAVYLGITKSISAPERCMIFPVGNYSERIGRLPPLLGAKAKAMQGGELAHAKKIVTAGRSK